MVFGRKQEVVPGQLYRKLGRTGHVYEVMSLKADQLGAVHIQMRRTDEHSARLTLAVSVLMDPNEFELVQG